MQQLRIDNFFSIFRVFVIFKQLEMKVIIMINSSDISDTIIDGLHILQLNQVCCLLCGL